MSISTISAGTTGSGQIIVGGQSTGLEILGGLNGNLASIQFYNAVGGGLFSAGTVLEMGVGPNSFNIFKASSVFSAEPLIVTSSISVVSGTSSAYEATFSTSTSIYHIAISTNGDFISNPSTIQVSGCGTSPSVIGSNNDGIVSIGGGSVTGCTLTFANGGWGTGCNVACEESDTSTTVVPDITSITPTTLTLGFSASLGGGTVWYHCAGIGAPGVCH
jgi:hypothetical protein